MLSPKTYCTALSAILTLPLLMGQGCPGVPDTAVAGTTEDEIALIKVSLASISTTVVPTLLTFNPNEAGKLVTMSIKSNATGSRVEVRIIDNLNSLVAVQTTPTSPNTTVSFMSTTTGTHQIQLRELGLAGSLYDVLVVQQP
jgi:hypothetical protein